MTELCLSKFKIVSALALGLIVLTLTTVASANEFVFSPAHGKVLFVALGRPKAIKIEGEGSGADGILTQAGTSIKGTLKFSLGTLTTGISMRDKHMKEKYLEVAKFPEAVLTITDFALTSAGPLKDFKDIPFKGSLKLKGVDKSVEGKATVTQSKTGFDVTAKFPIKLTDFEIKIPTYLGITVAEEVQVSVESKVESKMDSKAEQRVAP